jgi:hypothetical protein
MQEMHSWKRWRNKTNMQTERFYFTTDGSYGIVDDNFTIVNTSDFSTEEWDTIHNASDSMKMDYAMAYRELKDATRPIERGEWQHVSANIDYLIYEFKRGNVDDSEVLDILILIREGLGLND